MLNDILTGKAPAAPETTGHVYRQAGTPASAECTGCKRTYSTSTGGGGLCEACLSRMQHDAGARIMHDYYQQEARGRTGRIVAIVVLSLLVLVALTILNLAEKRQQREDQCRMMGGASWQCYDQR